MGVHYIYDTEGRKTGVIVPIDLWESLDTEKPTGELPRARGRGLPATPRTPPKDKQVGARDPRKYRGIYRNLNVDLEDEIRNLRDEWNRI
jgi:hypothetical protein